MSLVNVSGVTKRNPSLKQSVQVSVATQRGATTTKQCHSEKLSRNTYQPPYSLRPAMREGQTTQLGAQNCTSMQRLKLGKNLYVKWGRMIQEQH